MKLFIDIGIIIITILMMLAVGLAIDRKTTSTLTRQPGRTLMLLAAHVLIPPILGVAVVTLLDLPPYLAAAFLLLAACPIGDISNVYTIYARGNPALSLFLNAATCLLAPITMVAAFAAMSWLAHGDHLFAVPSWALIGRLLAFLLLPVAIGAILRFKKPQLADKLRRPIHQFVAIGIFIMLTVVLITQWQQVIDIGLPIALASLAFMLACMLIGPIVGKILQLPADGAKASLICFPVRNVGVATLIAVSILGRLDYASVVAIYFITEVPLILILSWLLKKDYLPPYFLSSSSHRRLQS